MNNFYAIAIADPSPRMTETYMFHEGTYKSAVSAARAAWREHGRSVCVFGANRPRSETDRPVPQTYYWHRISRDGSFVDRNTNSGVAESGTLAA